MNNLNIDLDFIKAGNAQFTVHNDKDEHYTFGVRKKEDRFRPGQFVYFASVRSGTNYGRRFEYLGVYSPLHNTVHPGREVKKEDKHLAILNWSLRVVIGNAKLPDGYGIEHVGKCGQCGKKLTDPLSMAYGFGTSCIHDHSETKARVDKLMEILNG
jgi:hypothetical protein